MNDNAYSLTVRGRPDLGSIDAIQWRDDEPPLLTITHGNVSRVVARFQNEEARQEFINMLTAMLGAVGVQVEETPADRMVKLAR